MKRNIFAVLLMMAACVQPAWSQGMKVWRDGKFIFYSVNDMDSVQFVTDNPTEDDHEYVDLGLPSRTLWATCNVGAESPEEFGDYFAWGETEPKIDGLYYAWETYKFSYYDPSEDGPQLWMYCTNSEDGFAGFTDGLRELEPDDDAATAKWGYGWQMPSKAQIEELIDERYTTTTFKRQNGVRGTLITSIANGNSIFLPAAGQIVGVMNEYTEDGGLGATSIYWTRSLHDSNSGMAYILFVNSSMTKRLNSSRYAGVPVRPVRREGGDATKLVERIELSETTLTLQPGETFSIYAGVYPTDADNTSVTWDSSSDGVAAVRPNDGFDAAGAPVANAATIIATGVGSCTIYCRATDGSGVVARCEVVVGAGGFDHEYVDLDLPSRTLWATCNVGANSPTDYGDYFAWGETSTKVYYTWDNYQWMQPGGTGWDQISKYTFADNQTSGCWYRSDTFVGDGIRELPSDDDAATANWGSEWQMPSIEQYAELTNSQYTDVVWTTENGVRGEKITSKRNGNSIFLPAAGYHDGSLLYDDGTNGHYWTRELSSNFTDYGDYFFFSQDQVETQYGGARTYGQSIRPVRK